MAKQALFLCTFFATNTNDFQKNSVSWLWGLSFLDLRAQFPPFWGWVSSFELSFEFLLFQNSFFFILGSGKCCLKMVTCKKAWKSQFYALFLSFELWVSDFWSSVSLRTHKKSLSKGQENNGKMSKRTLLKRYGKGVPGMVAAQLSGPLSDSDFQSLDRNRLFLCVWWETELQKKGKKIGFL